MQKDEREKKKEEKKKLQDELNTLFRPVQTVAKGKEQLRINTVKESLQWSASFLIMF